MVYGYKNDISFFCHSFAIGHGIIAAANMKAAAVKPDHNRTFFSVLKALRPDIEAKELFFVHIGFVDPIVFLLGYRPAVRAVTDLFPSIRILGRHKSFRLSVGYSFKSIDSVVKTPRYWAGLCIDNTVLGFIFRRGAG